MTFRFVGAVGILLGAVTFSACADRRFFGEPESKTLRDSGGAEYAAHELVFMPSAQGTADKLKAIYETMGAEVINETAPLSQSLGYVHLKLSPAMSADEAATLLLDSGLAESTEKNYVARIDVTPGDPSWDSLWGLRAIHGEEAWEISKGSDETVVAVLDTGIQYDHPDLDANIWTNEGETPGNGVDDDGNGWVDDVRGWNFGRSTGRASNDPYDIHSHGTHVAGTVGAVGDNGVGVVGVNWTVQIIAVNVFSKIGSGVGAYSTDIINGFVYAAANGAKAVNTSLGSYRRSSNLETNAVADLNDRGVLLVAAAGNMENNNDRNPHWPSNVDLANVIAVAAMKSDLSLTDRNDWGYKNGQPAGSSYGATTVDLAAPGHQINSTVPGSGYAKFSGTSMAAPHVAGAVALFYSQFPKVGHLEMKAHLLGSTQPSSSLSGKVLTGGYLDLKKLLRDFRGPPAPPRDFVAQVGPNRSIQVQWNWEAVMDPPSQDLAGFDLRYRPVGTTAYQELNLNPSDRVYELKGLTHETAYSVEIRSRGENGGLSEWVVSQDVLVGDNVAPAKVVDLMVSYPEGEEVNFAIMPGLESIDEYWSGAHLNDRRSETGWIAPYRSIDFEETLLIHLSEVVEIDQLHLLPNSVYPEFFPGTVQVETSLDGAAFEYGGVLRTAGNVASGQWQSVVMIPREAEWLRIHLSDAYSHASGRYYLGLSEVMVRKLRQDPMRLGLQFRAPGDDPDSGRAAKYEFYYSRYLGNTGGLANAQKLFEDTNPKPAGVLENFTTPELEPNTTFYFQLKAVDAAGNWSEWSNIAEGRTKTQPPPAIADLTVVEVGSNQVTFSFTPPKVGDPAEALTNYDVRLSEAPISPLNFLQATSLDVDFSYDSATDKMLFTVGGLASNRTYYFALQALGENGIRGGISNTVSAQPSDGTDDVAPATVTALATIADNQFIALAASPLVNTNLSANNLSDLVDRDPTTVFSQRANTDQSFQIEFELADPRALQWVEVKQAETSIETQLPGLIEVFVSRDRALWMPVFKGNPAENDSSIFLSDGLKVFSGHYVKLRFSALSELSDGTYGVDIADILFQGVSRDPAPIYLTWVAPGDDEWLGTVSRYDLYYSSKPFTGASLDAADVTRLEYTSSAPSGVIEVLEFTDLEYDQIYHFGIIAEDDLGNRSELSALTSFETFRVPPYALADLRHIPEAATTTSLKLEFQPAGADLDGGLAYRHECRRHTGAITYDNWETLPVVLNVVSQSLHHGEDLGSGQWLGEVVFGARFDFTMDGLEPTTAYQVACLAFDKKGNSSLISNIAKGETVDGTPPGVISDLKVEALPLASGEKLGLALDGFSGEYSRYFAASKLLDDDVTTSWAHKHDAAFVEFSMAQVSTIGEFKIRTSDYYPQFAPREVTILVKSGESDPWKMVLPISNFSAQDGWQSWKVGGVDAKYIRMETKPAQSGHYVVLSDFAAVTPPPLTASVRLSWIAPGDDDFDAQIPVDRYTLGIHGEYFEDLGAAAHRKVISANSQGRALVPGGNLEVVTVDELEGAAHYCFGLAAQDIAGNVSALSNRACTVTVGIPPPPVTDLEVLTESIAARSFALRWSISSEVATGYQLCVQPTGLTTESWANCDNMIQGGIGSNVTTIQVSVDSLNPFTHYFAAVRLLDSSGSLSPISNLVEVDTKDDLGPSAVADLSGHVNGALPGALTLNWSSPEDFGTEKTVIRYELFYRVGGSVTGENLGTSLLWSGSGGLSPKAPGSTEIVNLSQLPRDMMVHLAVRSFDEYDNASPLSNSVAIATLAEPPSPIGDLELAYATSLGAIELTWSAPSANYTHTHQPAGDGKVARYLVKLSDQALSIGEWVNLNAHSFLGGAFVKGMGESQNYTLTGLASGQAYYVALISEDEHGRFSGVSNIASITSRDRIAPNNPQGLTVTALVHEPTTLHLGFVAPGDDGAQSSDKVAGYVVRYYQNFGSVPAGFPESCGDGCVEKTFSSDIAAVGNDEILVLENLLGESSYGIAVQALDEVGNESGFSLKEGATGPVAPLAPSNFVAVEEEVVSADSVKIGLQWKAPSDVGPNGVSQRAARYIIGYSPSTSVSAQNLLDPDVSVTLIDSPPTPADPGENESLSLSGMTAGVHYQFGIIALDENSEASDVAQAVVQTTDIVSPDPPRDLVVTSLDDVTKLRIQWEAPAGSGEASDIATYGIVVGAPGVDLSGCGDCLSAQVNVVEGANYDFAGLVGETAYRVGVRACDESDNCSDFTLADGETSPISPARMDFSVVDGSRNTTSLSLKFVAPGDDDFSGRAASFEVYYSASEISVENFGDGNDIEISVAVVDGGREVVVPLTGLQPNSAYYVMGRAKDDKGVTSPLGVNFVFHTLDTLAPGMVTDISLSAYTTSQMKIYFKAPAEDGSEGGSPLGYYVRVSENSEIETEADWLAATDKEVVVGEHSPGDSISVGVFGLTHEINYGVAIRAFDEDGNLGPLHGPLTGSVVPISPSGVVSITSGVDGKTAIFTFVAPGDDGAAGGAVTAYEVARSVSNFATTDFDDHVLDGVEAVIAQPGEIQELRILCAEESTRYWFSIRAVDDWGAKSRPSEIVNVTTEDLTPPASSNLTARTLADEVTLVELDRATTTSSLGPGWESGSLVDGKLSSSWGSAALAVGGYEEIRIDLTDVTMIDRVRLVPDVLYSKLFPRDFEIQVGENLSMLETVYSVSDLDLRIGEHDFSNGVTFGFSPQSAKYVVIRVSGAGSLSAGDEQGYIALAEVQIVGARLEYPRVQLGWTAPGDDHTDGRASVYEVFADTTTLAADPSSALRLAEPSPPIPGPAGTLETMVLESLHGNTTYFFGVRAVDESSNEGELSNIASLATEDIPPRSAVAPQVIEATQNQIGVKFPSALHPAADTGYAHHYHLYYDYTPFYDEALPANSMDSFVESDGFFEASMTGLVANQVYYLGVIAYSESGLPSYLSPLLKVKTLAGEDTQGPEAVRSFNASIIQDSFEELEVQGVIELGNNESTDNPVSQLVDGFSETFWSYSSVDTAQVSVEYSFVSPKSLSRMTLQGSVNFEHLFPPAVEVSTRTGPSAPWTSQMMQSDLVIANASTPIELVFQAPLEGVVQVKLDFEELVEEQSRFHAALSEIRSFAPFSEEGNVVLSWIAPQDRGSDGGAASYEVLIALCDEGAQTCPCSDGPDIEQELSAALSPGSPERLVINLSTGAEHCLGVVAFDARGLRGDATWLAAPISVDP